MRTVNIYFNPYLERTRLIIDGTEHGHEGRRMDEFIVGQPMENWLAPYVVSYHRWDGVLAELMDELNDDELHLYFYSLPGYFDRVKQALRLQAEHMEGRGYSSGLWKCEYVEYYLPQKVKQEVRQFIYQKKYFAPDQFSMELLEYCRQELERHEEVTVEQLQEIYKELKKAVVMAIKFCREQEHNADMERLWEKAGKELERVFDCMPDKKTANHGRGGI